MLGDAVGHGVAVAISLAIAYLLTTSLHITLGEQVPKIYSIVHAESTVRRTARPLEFFKSALGPFIWLLNTSLQRRCCAWWAWTRAPSSTRPAAPRT